MDKMDTQGMSGPVDPNYKGSPKAQKHKPMEIHPRRLFTPEMVKEAKILINEVLDEREYKRRLRMSYDDVKEPGAPLIKMSRRAFKSTSSLFVSKLSKSPLYLNGNLTLSPFCNSAIESI